MVSFNTWYSFSARSRSLKIVIFFASSCGLVGRSARRAAFRHAVGNGTIHSVISTPQYHNRGSQKKPPDRKVPRGFFALLYLLKQACSRTKSVYTRTKFASKIAPTSLSNEVCYSTRARYAYACFLAFGLVKTMCQ